MMEQWNDGMNSRSLTPVLQFSHTKQEPLDNKK
jgi:hypothetical protein